MPKDPNGYQAETPPDAEFIFNMSPASDPDRFSNLSPRRSAAQDSIGRFGTSAALRAGSTRVPSEFAPSGDKNIQPTEDPQAPETS